MIAGFVIWSAVSLLLLGIGIWSWRSEKAAGFYTGAKPPEVTDVRAYNRSVGILWFVYALLFELLYVPLLIPALHDSVVWPWDARDHNRTADRLSLYPAEVQKSINVSLLEKTGSCDILFSSE